MLTTSPTKQSAFVALKGALLSGAYPQGRGALCRRKDDGTKEYCITGVIREVVLKTEWHDMGFPELVDNDGESSMIDAQMVSFMDLDRELTDFETDTLAEMLGSTYSPIDEGSVNRLEALQVLNDEGVSFQNLQYDVIERYGWNV